MLQLLVSARNLQEARCAFEAGANIVDLKEPRLGALGPVSWETVGQVVAALAVRVPLSLALGELTNLCHTPNHAGIEHARGLRYAKIGLAGLGNDPSWRDRWVHFRTSWPFPSRLVLAAYADWEVANAPSPSRVWEAVMQSDSPVFLLDTFDKHSRPTPEIVKLEQLQQWSDGLHRVGKLLALAGRLSLTDVPWAAEAGADIFAVRTAACRSSSRDGQLSPGAIGRLRAAIFDNHLPEDMHLDGDKTSRGMAQEA